MNLRTSFLPWIAAGLNLVLSGQAWGTEPWTLPRALERVQIENPAARIAQQRIHAARALQEQAQATWWPQFLVQSSYTRTDQPLGVFGAALSQRAFRSSLDFNNVPDADRLNVRGVVTLPLYAGGRLTADRTAAAAGLAAARAQATATRQELDWEVVRAFHTIHKHRALIQATVAAVRGFSHHLTLASNRFAAGTALRTDLLDLQVRLAQAQEDETRARHGTTLAEHALRNLLGLSEDSFTLSDQTPEAPVPATDDFSRRPELALVQHHQQGAAAELRRAQAGYRPRVNAFASFDHDRGWKFDGHNESYAAGVLAEWDLWDGGKTRGRIREAQARLSIAQEEERQLKLGIELEVAQAKVQLAEAKERLSVTASSLTLAGESAALTADRFEQGLALATQLIDAETALTTARVRRAEAEADHRVAIASLRKALGLPQLASEPTAP